MDHAPYVYQEIGGEKIEVPGRFPLLDNATYAFDITGQYGPSHTLTIDPVLDWSTYLGGTASDGGYDVAVDGAEM